MFLLKLVMRWLNPPELVKVDPKRMEEWLASLASSESGYKDYYTMRKKIINDAMVLGIEQREYWANCGRLMELKQMNAMAMTMFKEKRKYDTKENPEKAR